MAKAFETLNKINVNEHTEKKNGLTYLSWAWAWAEVKKAFPEATYTIYEDQNGCFYHTDGKTAWVKTGVTIEGIEMIEYLPVMDFRNKSIPVDNVTSFDVNKTIQRSLTKACARHGLGLYIYAGEDLPETDEQPVEKEVPKSTKASTKTAAASKKADPIKTKKVEEPKLKAEVTDKEAEAFFTLAKEIKCDLKKMCGGSDINAVKALSRATYDFWLAKMEKYKAQQMAV